MSHHYIRFTNVSYAYPHQSTKALDDVSFLVRHGERVALLGLNGSGKSTLLNLAAALTFPSTGEVNIGDVPATPKTARSIRRMVGYVFQNADDQLFMPTVEEDVAFGPRNMQLPENEVQRRVEKALSDVGALDLRHRSASQLSGGQKRAVAIATVLAMEPSILILDEPTANLDRATRRRLIEILDSFHHTVIIATHDLELAMEFCPRTIFLSKGKVEADDSTSTVLSDVALMTREHMDIPRWILNEPTR